MTQPRSTAPLKPRAQSMTGFGRALLHSEAGSITVELRSTNHRFLEVDQRLPSGLSSLQGAITEQIKRRIHRGRVDVSIAVQAEPRESRRVVFDEALLERYHAALIGLKSRFAVKGAITLDHLLALPQGILVTETRRPLERIGPRIIEAVGTAVQELARARQREGGKLVADLQRLLRGIERHVRAVQIRLPKALSEQRRRARKRWQELLGARGNGATAQLEEMAALLKEADVNEEVVRLQSHLSHVRQALSSGGLIGKQLDFIAQELMRETNTLGAKVNDAIAARHVVEIKGAIEKIREQVQNLE